MKLNYGTLRAKSRSITAALVFLACNGVAWADTYDPVSRQLFIPAVSVGAATFTNLTVTVTGLVRGPTGTAAIGDLDSYDTASGQLTIPRVTVGPSTYYNVVVTVGDVVSFWSVIGADSYSGTLFIPYVQVGNNVYHDVTISVGSVVNVIGGLPMNARDVYDPGTKQLTIAAVQAGGTIYTNVVITVGTIMSVGGLSPPVTLAPSALTFVCGTPGGCQPQSMLVINTGTTTLNISGITLVSQSYYNYPAFTEANTCGARLGPGQSCAGLVRFSTLVARNVHYTGSVTIADDAAGSPQVLSLTGYQ